MHPTLKMNCNMRSVLTTLLFLFGTLSLFAQRGENLETLHTAFITEKLNLSPQEAQKFWPVYNQYHSDMEALKKQRKDNKDMINKAGGIDNMSDADVQKLIASETDIESRELDLRKQYISKFEQVIPARKVAKFYIAEDEFKLYLLKQLTERRRGGMNRRDSGFEPQ